MLYEAKLPLKQVMDLQVGDTLMLELGRRHGARALRRRHFARRWAGSVTASRCASPKPLRKPHTTFAVFEKADETSTRMETR